MLRLVQTLHVMSALPETGHNEKAQVRLAMERNPFLARRLARLLGADSTGLSLKMREAQAKALRSISPRTTRGTVRAGFVEDLGAEDSPKILADLMEALIGAVALDEGGLQPTSCLLGSAMEEQELGTVGMRDMGANTRAATSQECSPPAPRGGGRGGACSAGA